MKNWIKKEKMYLMDASSQNLDCLPKGIYVVKFNPSTGIYLEKTSEGFEFNYKVYGVEMDFIERVVKSYEHATSNLGVLLNGVKGTGKTVTAELIAKSVDLPVIIINKDYKDHLVDFISSINQEVVLFFDEYEKIFEKTNHMLTVMDGVMSVGSKKLILLTTNKTYIDDNLLQRPSRIRYMKNFNGLSKQAVKEIANDLLENKDYMQDLMETLNKIEIVTIDVVKALITEVNLHEDLPSKLIKDFNVQPKAPDEYRIHLVENNKPKFLFSFDTRYSSFDVEIGEYLPVPNAGDIGEIIETRDKDFIVKLFRTRPYTGYAIFDKHLELQDGETQFDKGRHYRQNSESDTVVLHLRAEIVEQKKFFMNLAF